eukprot:5777516-Amphidinium_carterae.2
METSSDASIDTRSAQETPKLWERTRREEPDISGVGAGILCQNGFAKHKETPKTFFPTKPQAREGTPLGVLERGERQPFPGGRAGSTRTLPGIHPGRERASAPSLGTERWSGCLLDYVLV